MPPEAFAARIAAWQRTHGRHDLPWQGTRDPYRRWLSEIMLQQTQVAAVIPYYLRFLERFPDVRALAAASLDEVLQAWSGLGYYSRARNLHAAAIRVCAQGGFPASAAGLEALPGIGRSTAAAIAVFAHGERAAILDGNVRRVLCRHRGVEGFPGLPAVERRLWGIAEAELPGPGDVEAYTQGLMDLGATVCTRARPDCAACPVASDCVARADGRVAALPSPRPRREVPVRETAMLLFVARDAVLLEQRPPSGIWGGLWSLPEAPEEDADEKARTLGLAVRERRRLEPFLHRFTHFGLRVQPLLLEVDGAALSEPVARADHRWLPLAGAAEAALPRPVKTLLCGLAAGRVRERCGAG